MKPCCQDLSKREVTQPSPDLTVSVCSTCGCRHFELNIDPVSLGVTGKGI